MVKYQESDFKGNFLLRGKMKLKLFPWLEPTALLKLQKEVETGVKRIGLVFWGKLAIEMGLKIFETLKGCLLQKIFSKKVMYISVAQLVDEI